MRKALTDIRVFLVADQWLREHQALRPRKARDDDMEQAWHDTLDDRASRAVFYAALVIGESKDHAKIYADVPNSPESQSILQRARRQVGLPEA